MNNYIRYFFVGLFTLLIQKTGAQTTLPVSRTTWDVTPVGWTDNGTGSYLTTSACTGSNMGQLNSTGDFYTVWFTGTPGTLTYTIKGFTFSGGTVRVEESPDNSTWSTITDHTTIAGTCTNFSSTLAAATRYVRFNYVFKSAGNVGLDDVQITALTTCTAASEPTLQATSLSFTNVQCTSLTVNWSNGNGAKRIVVAKSASAVAGAPADQVAYAANSTFGFGSIIAANEFVVYNGTGSTVTVTGLATNTTYHFKIFEYNGNTADCQENYLTSGSPLSGSRITNTCTQVPFLTGVLINSCSGASPCSEGQNEIMFLNSGDYSIPVNAANIKVFYNSVTPATTNFTESFASNSAYIDTLNLKAGCGALFVDALSAGTIPANSIFMIMDSNPCYSYELSEFCVAGTIYVLFSTDASWASGGNFANSGAGSYYFRTDFTGVAGSSVIDYSYQPSSFANADGSGVSFPPSGGAATSYYNSGDCSPPLTILPIELLYFNASSKGEEVILNWVTSSEINNDYFTIERTVNGEQIDVVVEYVKGAGNSNFPKAYVSYDKRPVDGLSYYRLRQTDYDGNFSYSDWVAVKTVHPVKDIIIKYQDGKLVIIGKNTVSLDYEISDIAGRLVNKGRSDALNEINTIEIPSLTAGIYFVKTSTSEITKVTKIIVL